MPNIPVGTKGEEKLLVTNDVAIDFMGGAGARVLSTPNLVHWLEMTARNSVVSLLDPGHDTVGITVHISHLAATPVGMVATFRSEVLSVEDRRINFKVEAWDEKDKIAEGTHQRAVVNVAKFATRVQAKAAQG